MIVSRLGGKGVQRMFGFFFQIRAYSLVNEDTEPNKIIQWDHINNINYEIVWVGKKFTESSSSSPPVMVKDTFH